LQPENFKEQHVCGRDLPLPSVSTVLMDDPP
jgi:hypothetical protein